MEESILKSIRETLGPSGDYDAFDTDLIIHINSVFQILQQLGVGPKDGFVITGPDEKWTDFLPPGQNLNSVKSYMYMKVKLIFDNASMSGPLAGTFEKLIAELEWRLNVACDPVKFEEIPDD